MFLKSCLRAKPGVVFVLGAIAFQPFVAAAEPGGASPLPAPSPFAVPGVCVGYNPVAKDWGLVGSVPYTGEGSDCPEGFAFINAHFVAGQIRDAEFIPVRGICCELPKGALTTEHVYSVTECPADTVVTGARPDPAYNFSCPEGWDKCEKRWLSIPQQLRCTRVSPRLRVSAPTPSWVLGYAAEVRTWRADRARHVALPMLPPAIRYAIARKNQYGRHDTMCLGFPFGSSLVGKTEKGCGFLWGQIQYRGLPGDPAAGTPLKTYPDCLALSDPFDPNAKCIPP